MQKSKTQRIIGIDYGMRRMGLALSDERQIIATPYLTLTVDGKMEQFIQKFLETVAKIEKEKECTIKEIIVGLPLMMSGRTGFLADEVKHFIALLEQATSIPVKHWDERLSTVQAERALREGNMSRKKRSKFVDTVSAAIVLQSYLDYTEVQPL